MDCGDLGTTALLFFFFCFFALLFFLSFLLLFGIQVRLGDLIAIIISH